MPAGRVHLSVDEARSIGERAMRGIGYDPEEARIVTDHVIDAALCGYEYSGLAKLLNVPEHRRFNHPRQPSRLILDVGTSALMATELQSRVRRNEALLGGGAIDRDGRHTTDPAEAQAGALLPFAGYKGFGLGLVVQALGVLGGAGMVEGAQDGYL